MKINYVNGDNGIDTNDLPDVDALLMEESSKLHALFAKYNRQVCIMGEMKGSTSTTSQNGCTFFHIGPKNMTREEHAKEYDRYMTRIACYVYEFTGGRFMIGLNPDPPMMPPTASQQL